MAVVHGLDRAHGDSDQIRLQLGAVRLQGVRQGADLHGCGSLILVGHTHGVLVIGPLAQLVGVVGHRRQDLVADHVRHSLGLNGQDRGVVLNVDLRPGLDLLLGVDAVLDNLGGGAQIHVFGGGGRAERHRGGGGWGGRAPLPSPALPPPLPLKMIR